MAITFGKKKYRQHYGIYTVITAILLCVVFLAMVGNFYVTAEEEAFEYLHVQTKQIKDDINLQLVSDRENLATMANFAAKLHSDGESYDLMFDSFKPIGLIENIGILNPDNTFVTKAGSIDLDGAISFEEEKQRGAYISGRIPDLTRDGYEIIRSAVPIVVNRTTVGILYGVIKLDKIGERYERMAAELDAQLFVYDKQNGDLVIDTIHDELGNISFLKDRKYNKDYSYEQIMTTVNGFSSFESAYRDETLYLHYSTIDDINWVIAMARYESQVFADTHALSQVLLIVFIVMASIIGTYITLLMSSERKVNRVTNCASEIRRILLETSGNHNHINEALKQVCLLADSMSAVFFNTDGEDYSYTDNDREAVTPSVREKKYFVSQLFRYAAEYHKQNKAAVSILRIIPNKHLRNTNPEFYKFLKEHQISDVSLSATINNANHITILAVLNARHGRLARMLAEKVSACFSMALYNKNNLSKTQIAATTDALTGASNRVAYKNDRVRFDEEQPLDFSCIYVDVNELHTLNNKYGHAAGDEMLMYIANTLKEVFYGHKVYRMGGDEFLVFCKNTDQVVVQSNIELFVKQLEPRKYHVAIGMSYRSQNTNTEEMVREAELRMYEAKAEYYQNKEQPVDVSNEGEYIRLETGIIEIDTMLSVLKESYNGIYRVSIDTDKAKHILMPAYLCNNENEDRFSALFNSYVNESVDPEYHRAISGFMNYDAIKHTLAEGKTPQITYKNTNGETVVLSVYQLCGAENSLNDTLWVFAKG